MGISQHFGDLAGGQPEGRKLIFVLAIKQECFDAGT